MKNFLKKSTYAIIFILLLISCSENIKHEFSHDPEINSWVKQHKKEILTYNREKIKTYNLAKQKAILRVFSPEKKKAIWKEKIDYIFSLELSEEEKKYFNKFKTIFKALDYKEPISDELDGKLYKLVINGKELFDWDDKFIYETFFSVGDVNQIKSKSTVNLSSKAVPVLDDEDKVDCYCRYSISCPGFSPSCKDKDKCENANTDCGVLGTSSCTGYCI